MVSQYNRVFHPVLCVPSIKHNSLIISISCLCCSNNIKLPFLIFRDIYLSKHSFNCRFEFFSKFVCIKHFDFLDIKLCVLFNCVYKSSSDCFTICKRILTLKCNCLCHNVIISLILSKFSQCYKWQHKF